MTTDKPAVYGRVSIAMAIASLAAALTAWYADEAGHVPLFLGCMHGFLLINIGLCARPLLPAALHPRLLRPLVRRLIVVALLLTVALWGLTVAATFDFFTLRVYMQDTPTAEQRALRAQAEPSAPAEAAPRPAAVDLSRYSVPE